MLLHKQIQAPLNELAFSRRDQLRSLLWFSYDRSSYWNGIIRSFWCIVPAKSMPCGFWPLITLNSPCEPCEKWHLWCQSTNGTCSHRWRCFCNLRWHCPRGVYTPKKWLTIFTFIEWVSPIQSHSVFAKDSGPQVHVHKKTSCLVSLWETGFRCSKGRVSLYATVIKLMGTISSQVLAHSLTEHSAFI